MALREVVQITGGVRVSDNGEKLRRYLGTPELDQVDPFLLPDWFESAGDGKPSGFAPHPHRGFATISLVLEGRMRHRDNQGHSGEVGAGGVQYMRAGSGLLHGEMSESEGGRRAGLQFWLNLPKAEKFDPPSYVNAPAADVPHEDRDGADVAVLVGISAQGTKGAIDAGSTEPLLLRVKLDAGARFAEPVPAGRNAFLVVISGAVDVAGTMVSARQVAVLGAGDDVAFTSGEGADVLLVAGRPIGEPVARGGPFVMNTRQEVLQAFRDYQEGRFGAPISASGAAS
jgi:redox-sensitive bicupin YhaK (pirin superfamily)